MKNIEFKDVDPNKENPHCITILITLRKLQQAQLIRNSEVIPDLEKELREARQQLGKEAPDYIREACHIFFRRLQYHYPDESLMCPDCDNIVMKHNMYDEHHCWECGWDNRNRKGE